MIAMPRKWIQGAAPKKGALHRELGHPSFQHIPEGLLHDIYTARVGTHVRGHQVTTLLKRRVIFAVNAQKRRR